MYPRDTRMAATPEALLRYLRTDVAGKGEGMSDDPNAPPIGHNRPPLSEEEHAELIERVAEDLWHSRDDRTWEQAGDAWRQIFREHVTIAIASYERHLRALDRT